jgi:hypothetical protein
MPTPSRLRAVALLGCLLTVVASGDDFCLVRVVFPAACAGSLILPLDDPNTDFLEPADSPVGDLLAKDSCRGPSTTSGVSLAGGAGPAAPPHLSPPASRPDGRTTLHTPLRC